MASPRWLTPSPLWLNPDYGLKAPEDTYIRPWLAEMATDNFMPQFLAMLQREYGPAELVTLRPATAGNEQSLFQPTQQRYYLVTASLVCTKACLHDHKVDSDNNERVYCVLRRIGEDLFEEGFVPGTGWLPLDEGATLVPNDQKPQEQMLPSFSLKMAASVPPGTSGDSYHLSQPQCRSIHFSYIPVTNRIAYMQAGSSETSLYVARFVYIRQHCPPLLSAPTNHFRLAPAFDPALPLPDRGGNNEGKPSDTKGFKRFKQLEELFA